MDQSCAAALRARRCANTCGEWVRVFGGSIRRLSVCSNHMPPNTRRRAAHKRLKSDDGSVLGTAATRRVRARAGQASAAATALRVVDARDGGNSPTTSTVSKSWTADDFLSALCERAVSNSVPLGARSVDADDDGDADGEGCSEMTSSQGTQSAGTSSLRVRRSLPGLRLPNEAFDSDRPDEGDREIESERAEMPSDGWIQPCFACGRWTWQNVSLGGFRVYRCSTCATQFRARANELKTSSDQDADAGKSAADEGDEDAKNKILASLVSKLQAVVQHAGRAPGSIAAIE